MAPVVRFYLNDEAYEELENINPYSKKELLKIESGLKQSFRRNKQFIIKGVFYQILPHNRFWFSLLFQTQRNSDTYLLMPIANSKRVWNPCIPWFRKTK